MILVDSRAGSDELVKPLAKLGLPVEETTLDYGDIAFLGRGEKGKQVFVGIEHKKMPDLVQSLTSGRLQGHQLPGMLDMYDRSWLVVEGEWQHTPDGTVHMWKAKGRTKRLKGAPPAVELEKQILTLELRGGFRVRHCPTRRDTLRFIFALYRWWTDKDMDEHKSHLAIHAPDIDRRDPNSDFVNSIAMIPGIGLQRAKAVESVCFDVDKGEGSFRKLHQLTASEWAALQTEDTNGKLRRIGDSTARKIMEALR